MDSSFDIHGYYLYIQFISLCRKVNYDYDDYNISFDMIHFQVNNVIYMITLMILQEIGVR